MGRRQRGRDSHGGGKLHSSFDQILNCRIKSAPRKSHATVEQLVDHLRSTYPQYARQKVQPFTKRVQKIIQISSIRVHAMDASGNDGDDASSERKKTKIADEKEENMQLIEAQLMRKRNVDIWNSSSGCSSASVASAGSSRKNSGMSSSLPRDESSDEDAIYGEKFEPEFDLMQSMLREKLLQKSKDLGKSGKDKESMELDVVDNKDVKQVISMDVEDQLCDDLNKGTKKDGRDDNEIKEPMFKDLGGMRGVINELIKDVIVPLYHLKITRHLGVKPVSGILLHGPPGCGKTKLAHAIANEIGVPFYKISAAELVSGVSGASEENIRELFSKAYRTATSIVFIDEIDAIASKRENLQGEMGRRIVTQLMTCMDELHRLVKPIDDNGASESSDSGHVLVIAATNRVDAIDPALRRPGRFDREIALGVPDESARIEILSVLTRNMKLDCAFDLLKKIARSTPGFVGADLVALTNKAGYLAINRILDKQKVELCEEPTDSDILWKQPWSHDMEELSITMSDFEEAAKTVQSSSLREGFSAIPNVKWDDVGGLHLLRQECNRYIVRPIKFPEYYENLGLDLGTGFLFYGPPGCGKTLIAKAVANEAGANFIYIKGPELLNKYVGESELAVRRLFSRARTCSPCILFFDEVDALTTKRGREGGWVAEGVLKQLLIELDGAEQRRGVYVIGATNSPEVMDPAVLRPGRFGKLMYVPLPSSDERGLILKALARNRPIDVDVDLMALGQDPACENLSGADLAALMKEAAMAAVEDELTGEDELTLMGSSNRQQCTIKEAHFRRALQKISPSVSKEQKRYYTCLSESFKVA